VRQGSHDRRPAIYLVLLLVALFGLMAGQIRGGPFRDVEGFLLHVASPVLRAARGVTDWVGETASSLTGSDRPSRVRDLEEQVVELQLEKQRSEEARLENERLRSLLDLKQSLPIPTLAATVVANSFRAATKTCLIDRGTSAGVRSDMPVVNPRGVVGRIWSAGTGLSKVQLLTDSSAGVAVLVQRTRVQGVLMGRGDQLLELRYVSTIDDVATGDLLLTSGQDRIYPRGLPVGVVAEVQGGPGLLRTVTVVPRVDFDRLEEVLVLMKSDIPERLGDAPP
jgi:rod shape-determining protein MreC